MKEKQGGNNNMLRNGCFLQIDHKTDTLHSLGDYKGDIQHITRPDKRREEASVRTVQGKGLRGLCKVPTSHSGSVHVDYDFTKTKNSAPVTKNPSFQNVQKRRCVQIDLSVLHSVLCRPDKPASTKSLQGTCPEPGPCEATSGKV